MILVILIRVSRLAVCTMCVYNSTKRYAYCVDLNIDVAITSYSTRISRVLQDFYVWHCTHSSTPVRYGSTRIYYSYGTVATCTRTVLVPARRILFEIKYGTSTVQYSTVQYSTVAYSYNKYKRKKGA